MKFLSKIKRIISSWISRHIIAELPPDEDEEFSEKYRK
jgi:hypothetical protein